MPFAASLVATQTQRLASWRGEEAARVDNCNQISQRMCWRIDKKKQSKWEEGMAWGESNEILELEEGFHKRQAARGLQPAPCVTRLHSPI